jgi:hypothetical protein
VRAALGQAVEVGVEDVGRDAAFAFEAGLAHAAFADGDFDGAVLDLLGRQVALGEEVAGFLVAGFDGFDGLDEFAEVERTSRPAGDRCLQRLRRKRAVAREIEAGDIDPDFPGSRGNGRTRLAGGLDRRNGNRRWVLRWAGFLKDAARVGLYLSERGHSPGS